MSGSRGFYYDDARSLDRWNREWTPQTPGRWSLIYDTNRFWYRCQPGGAGNIEFATLMSVPAMKNVEIRATVRSNNVNGAFGIWVRKDRQASETVNGNVLVFQDLSVLYFWGYFDGGWVNLGQVANVIVANQIYNYRVQSIGDQFRVKLWLLGTAEPNWMLTIYVGRLRKPLPSNSTIGIRAQYAYIVDFSDIRITPIRKVGGP